MTEKDILYEFLKEHLFVSEKLSEKTLDDTFECWKSDKLTPADHDAMIQTSLLCKDSYWEHFISHFRDKLGAYGQKYLDKEIPNYNWSSIDRNLFNFYQKDSGRTYDNTSTFDLLFNRLCIQYGEKYARHVRHNDGLSVLGNNSHEAMMYFRHMFPDFIPKCVAVQKTWIPRRRII